MADIAWSQAYSIENDSIDKEHQQIFTLANDVQSYADDDKKLKEAVKAVVEYTKHHFKSEQEYMKSINYTHLNHHINLHKQIIQELMKFLKDINTLSNEQITQTLHEFITNQIISHILIEDKKVQYHNKSIHQLREFFSWKNIYGIGNETLDSDHKKLFSIAIKVLNHSQNKQAKLQIKETIKELYLYMRKHFENEENYMKKIDYKAYDEHVQLHENIMIQMKNFLKNIGSMDKDSLDRALIEYMDIWLVNHIVVEDRKIAQFAIQKKYLS